MDETCSVKNFKFDPKSSKIKFIKTLEMTTEDKSSFET
jgi:hypothetical protein